MPVKIQGIIESGKLIKQIVEYPCIKCSDPVRLEFNHAITEKTFNCFSDMLDGNLCLNCHCDSKVPEVVECLFH